MNIKVNVYKEYKQVHQKLRRKWFKYIRYAIEEFNRGALFSI